MPNPHLSMAPYTPEPEAPPMPPLTVTLSASGDSFDVLIADPLARPAATALPPVPGRHPHWAVVARDHVEAHPYCGCCRVTRDLQVHHVIPFHVRPDLELDHLNLLVLCRRCHLFVGHLGDWRSWNVTVRADAAAWRRKLDDRPHA